MQDIPVEVVRAKRVAYGPMFAGHTENDYKRWRESVKQQSRCGPRNRSRLRALQHPLANQEKKSPIRPLRGSRGALTQRLITCLCQGMMSLLLNRNRENMFFASAQGLATRGMPSRRALLIRRQGARQVCRMQPTNTLDLHQRAYLYGFSGLSGG